MTCMAPQTLARKMSKTLKRVAIFFTQPVGHFDRIHVRQFAPLVGAFSTRLSSPAGLGFTLLWPRLTPVRLIYLIFFYPKTS